MIAKPKPAWWLLFGIVPVMLGLLILQVRLPAGEDTHKLLEMLIVVLAFGLMWLWVRANQGALAAEESRGARVTVIYDSSLDEPVDQAGVDALDEIGDLELTPWEERYNKNALST